MSYCWILEAVSGDYDIIATEMAKSDPMVRLDVTLREDERRNGELSSREDRRSLAWAGEVLALSPGEARVGWAGGRSGSTVQRTSESSEDQLTAMTFPRQDVGWYYHGQDGNKERKVALMHLILGMIWLLFHWPLKNSLYEIATHQCVRGVEREQIFHTVKKSFISMKGPFNSSPVQRLLTRDPQVPKGPRGRIQVVRGIGWKKIPPIFSLTSNWN